MKNVVCLKFAIANFYLNEGFDSVGASAHYWSSTPADAKVGWTNSSAYLYTMTCSDAGVYLMSKFATFGKSIRCVKD